MNSINWDSSYTVRIDELDDQNKQILKTINSISECANLSVRSGKISDILNELTIHARKHFQMEETLLEKHGYPELSHQKEEHKAFRIKIVALCEDTMQRKESVPADIQEFLNDWWTNHILKSDLKYHSFFKRAGNTE